MPNIGTHGAFHPPTHHAINTEHMWLFVLDYEYNNTIKSHLKQNIKFLLHKPSTFKHVFSKNKEQLAATFNLLASSYVLIYGARVLRFKCGLFFSGVFCNF